VPLGLAPFPTRRSSDLAVAQRDDGVLRRQASGRRVEKLLQARLQAIVGDLDVAPQHGEGGARRVEHLAARVEGAPYLRQELGRLDRKSTRLNSSHVKIS